MSRVMRWQASTTRIRIRAAVRNIIAAAVDRNLVVAGAGAVVEVGVMPAVSVTRPIYPAMVRATRRRVRLRPERLQISQEPIRSATNVPAMMASARSTHTAAVNSAAAGNGTDTPGSRVATRVVSRTAAAAAQRVAVAAVMAGSLEARAQAVAAVTAVRAAVGIPAASHAWAEPERSVRDTRAVRTGRAGCPTTARRYCRGVSVSGWGVLEGSVACGTLGSVGETGSDCGAGFALPFMLAFHSALSR